MRYIAGFLVILLTTSFAIASTDSNKEIQKSFEVEYNCIFEDIIKAKSGTSILYKQRSNNVLPKVADVQSLIWESDRDPFDVSYRRTVALLELLKPKLSKQKSLYYIKQLQNLNSKGIDALSKSTIESRSERKSAFLALCNLRRQLAFDNPLLNFDEIIFMATTGGSTGFWQFLGTNGNGEGLIVVSGWKSGPPQIRKILNTNGIVNGPAKGTRLNGVGSFGNVFDLSYDGNSIVFSASVAGRSRLLKVNKDGTNLTDLMGTDTAQGTCLHPCFTQNNRILYVSNSLRYGDRCGGKSYTLHSMKTDGTDWFPISWHETAEYHPVIDNDGKCVYSRWDYIDRDFNAAHNIWSCGIDGTDPRSYHGNYPYPHDFVPLGVKHDYKRDRPQTEFMIRPIPGTSGLYAAMAGRHHEPMLSTIVLLNTSIPDDNKMSQVTIFTGGCLPAEDVSCRWDSIPCVPCQPSSWYTSPWPLSKDFMIASDWGSIVLIDKFGNKEVIYNWVNASNNTSAVGTKGFVYGPRPFQSRTPPKVPSLKTFQGERASDPSKTKATISVMNVYDADFPWPDSLKIVKQLRIIQYIPLDDSRNWDNYDINHRMVLGTVPVESDGSAYFEAPVGKLIYFQALDQHGSALQSMRSGTYVHPGEQLSCRGCHEDKWKSTPVTTTPLALKRAPSQIKPEPEGSMPLNYVRLAKPVLENKCFPCHKQNGVTTFSSLTVTYDNDAPQVGMPVCPNPKAECKWFTAYRSHGGGASGHRQGYRSQLNNIGARSTPIGKALLTKHLNRLTADELRRMFVWLDGNAQIYCAYQDTALQSKGQIIWPNRAVDPKNPTGVELNTTNNLSNLSKNHQITFKTYLNNKHIVIKHGNFIGKIKVVNCIGRKVVHFDLNGNTSTTSLKVNSGLFIIHFSNKNVTYSQSVLVP